MNHSEVESVSIPERSHIFLWSLSILVALSLGVLLAQQEWLSGVGIIGSEAGSSMSSEEGGGDQKVSNEPLYWVAPMDPNFRRDGPGLSPMGMELIPVYAEDTSDSPGTVIVAGSVMQSLGVTLGKAQKMPLVVERRLPAQVVGDPATEWMLMSRVDGWVEQQFVFRVGETVSRGDPLLTLYSPRLVSAQEELLTALESGRTALIEASRSRLVAMGMTPRWVKNIERRRVVQQKVTILAPQNGTVTALALQPGRRLTPATHLLTLTDFSQLWIETDIYGDSESMFGVGDLGTITLANIPLTLTIAETYPLLDRLGNYRMRFELENPDGVYLPGMWGEVLLRKQYSAVLQIPLDAVIDDGFQPRVVLLTGTEGESGKKFKSVAVQTGRRGGRNTDTGVRWVEVIAGLEAGDQVVTSGQFMLDSESSVSSDLLRYDPRDHGMERVWIEAQLAPAGVSQGRIMVQHQGIPEWQWPAMTQDFHLALPASEVTARPGESLRMELVALDDGDYCVTQLEKPGTEHLNGGGMKHDHSHH